MKIDHIGIAVENLTEALEFYEDKLKLGEVEIEKAEGQGVKVGFFAPGESKIELLEPLTDSSPIARHLKRRGPGLHHLALQVEDIEAEVARLQEQGVKFLSDEPQEGAGGKKIIFIHPRAAGGVLMELCQSPVKEED